MRELHQLGVGALQREMESGGVTARRVVDHCLERIESIDRRGPSLNSILEINPDAQGIADCFDRERAEGRIRSALHGIPVVLKANIDTCDRMATTAGSLALAGSIAMHDAFVVRRLREAGAVILAKANLSEWANFRGA